MTSRHRFLIWLALFLGTSLLWLSSLPWGALMGSAFLFVATLGGTRVSRWREEPRFRNPRVVAAVQLTNMAPLFVALLSNPLRGNPSSGLKVVYGVAAVLAIGVNAYAGLSQSEADAA